MKKLYPIFIFLVLPMFQSLGEEKAVEKTVIHSDKMDRNSNNVIRAIGDVEIKRGNRIFNANEVEYNQNTRVIKANSEVRVLDRDTNTLYFSETAQSTDDFNTADFRNGIVVFENGSDIMSERVRKISENEILMGKTLYSVCPTDIYDEKLTYEKIMEEVDRRKTPLFSLRSSKVRADTEKKRLSLWGTSVWVWKIPIFYLPYMKTGSSFGQEANGFDIPGFEDTSHYGYGVYIPYKISTKNQKIRITPKIYEKGNYLLNLTYIAHSPEDDDRWQVGFRGDITNDNGKSKDLTNAYGITEKEEGDYRQWRGYASSVGRYDFTDIWGFDYDAAIMSDRYYYRDYYQSGLAYVESNFKFTGIDMKDKDNFNYFQFSNLFYQELLEKDTSYNAPRYAPVTNTNLQNTIAKNDYNNLFYRVKLNTTNLFRNTGVEYNRVTLTPSLYDTLNTDVGTFNASFELQADAYVLNEVGYNPKTYDGTESRIFPQFNLEWRKAFTVSNFLFQPIVKYSVSSGSDGFEKHVPNEDSEPQNLSFENIFSDNRFIGYDRQEFGNRVSYGFEVVAFNNFSFGIAQGYRENISTDNDKYLLGFEEHMSDYVGYASYILNDNLDINYRFLTDKDDFEFKKHEWTLNIHAGIFDVYFIYTNIKPNIFYEYKQEQINSGVDITIFGRWKLSLSGINDLENDNRFIESEIGLVYDGNCTRWGVTYKRTNPLTETDKSSSINFNLNLKFM